MNMVVLTVERFPTGEPRRSIGLMKWVLREAMPRSEIAVRAQKQLDRFNGLILSGKVQLNYDKEDGELPALIPLHARPRAPPFARPSIRSQSQATERLPRGL